MLGWYQKSGLFGLLVRIKFVTTYITLELVTHRCVDAIILALGALFVKLAIRQIVNQLGASEGHGQLAARLLLSLEFSRHIRALRQRYVLGRAAGRTLSRFVHQGAQ